MKKSTNQSHSGRKAYTLVELLVVIMLLGLLASIAIASERFIG